MRGVFGSRAWRSSVVSVNWVMAKFLNSDLAELAHQLTLSPTRIRPAQIGGIERLLGLIEPDRAYPYDFVCFHITEYRRRGESAGAMIPGAALIRDLISMAEVITRTAQLPIRTLGEPSLTHEEVTTRLGVSKKTIRRWRPRGLLGVWVTFEDGVSRLAFLTRSVDRFARQNKALVARGAAFKQLTSKERRDIVDRARVILTRKRLKLTAVARVIAAETDRALETVRYTLRRYDRANNGNTPLFDRTGDVPLDDRYRMIVGRHRAGESVASIAESVASTESAVSAILREVRVRQWKTDPPAHIHNELFDATGADEWILDVPEPPASEASLPRPPRDLPAYLQSLYRVPLLTPQQEADLFRRYNYIKFKAAAAIKDLDPLAATDEEVARVQSLIDGSDALKQRLIAANLRLVVSIAKRHVGRGGQIFDIISDGNVSLMRAIEKFDFGRGFRFSTYATWVIVKSFAREIPEGLGHYQRYVTGQDELLAAAPDRSVSRAPESDRRRVRQTIAEGMELLSDREREIVTSHFGLSRGGTVQTLEQLGKRFGVTKERIRQIEKRALDQLREALSPSLVEVLA